MVGCFVISPAQFMSFIPARVWVVRDLLRVCGVVGMVCVFSIGDKGGARIFNGAPGVRWMVSFFRE